MTMCNLKSTIKLTAYLAMISDEGKFMENPIEAIVEWIKNTPQEYQKDIAFLVGYSIPYLPSDITFDDTENLVDNLITLLNKHNSGDHKDVGFVILFKGLIEHLFISKRSRSEHWEDTISMQEKMLQNANVQSNESMKKTLTKMIEVLPKHQKNWIEICARWNEMASIALSDDNLDLWYKSQMKPIELKPMKINCTLA